MRVYEGRNGNLCISENKCHYIPIHIATKSDYTIFTKKTKTQSTFTHRHKNM